MTSLYIVATPIGNMEDITLRALRTLREVNAIFAEDTRVISKLLAKYEIRTSVYRLDAKMEHKRVDEIIERLGGGENIAFVSDAGTPGVSDPGTYLVGRVREAGFKVETIPGPSALTAALSIAGVPIDEFMFIGFLPHKKGRKTALEAIAARECATVLYESPHRILKLLEELASLIPERKIVVARELTKLFENVRYDTPRALAESLAHDKADRGEFVVIIPYS